MRALIDGQEIDIAPDELPAFTFSIEDSLDIGSSRGARSTSRGKLAGWASAQASLGSWCSDRKPASVTISSALKP